MKHHQQQQQQRHNGYILYERRATQKIGTRAPITESSPKDLIWKAAGCFIFTVFNLKPNRGETNHNIHTIQLNRWRRKRKKVESVIVVWSRIDFLRGHRTLDWCMTLNVCAFWVSCLKSMPFHFVCLALASVSAGCAFFTLNHNRKTCREIEIERGSWRERAHGA